MDQILNYFNQPIGSGIVNLVIAFVILIVGYIVARIIASLVRRLFERTDLDNRLADAISDPDKPRKFDVEDFIGKVTFWFLMLFVLVAFFQRLGMFAIAAPIAVFLERFTADFLPRLGGAALLLFVAWIIASVLRFLVRKGTELLKLDERLSEHAALEEDEQVSFGKSLATAVFWFVLLLFLPTVLSALGIDEIARPVEAVFIQIFAYIPNILAAVVVFLIGWFIARVIRRVVTNLLKAIGTDKLGQRAGLSEERSLSDLVGMILYVFILLVTIITALDQLDIDAISAPTTKMLTTIADAIPGIIAAALVLVISYAIARLVAGLVSEFLAGIGFDTIPEKLGIKWSATTSLSQWVSYLVVIAIMLFATMSATELLGSTFLTVTLNLIIGFFWKVILAVVVFTIGLYLARLAYNFILQTGTNQANFIGRMAQIAIIIFAGAIALREVGVASDIINLAFGITLGAIGVAIALAFGLGSTKIAEREVDQFIEAWRAPKGETDTEVKPE
jgi:small-conductance mechanosensitive channel